MKKVALGIRLLVPYQTYVVRFLSLKTSTVLRLKYKKPRLLKKRVRLRVDKFSRSIQPSTTNNTLNKYILKFM
jgi:hypothetical protein